MADTGWVDPTDSAQYDYGGGASWSNLSNAYSQNDTHASCDVHTVDHSDRITYFDFDFSSIPSGSSIDGVEFRYDGYDETGLGLYHVQEFLCQLHIGGTVKGDDKFISADVVHGSDTDTYHSFGGASDDWGTNYRWDDIQDSGFGVSMVFYNEDILDYLHMYVDHVQLKIHYTEDNPDPDNDTGWISPGTMAEYTRTDGSVWSFEDNAKTQSDTYADTNIPKEEFSTYLGASNFSFGLPTGATVHGVEVRYEVYTTSVDGAREEIVRLHKAGTQSGDDKATGRGFADKTGDNDTYYEFGDWNDMWSTGWGYSDVTSSDFGVLFAMNNIDDAVGVFVYVDHIQIKITYTPLGYGNDVNDVSSINIDSINDVDATNIQTVNDV